MIPEDKLEAIEEMVVVGVPVRRACMGWARSQSLLVCLSGTETPRPAAENQHGGEGRRPQRDGTTGPVSDQCISWFTVLAGNCHAGVAVFSPLDEGNTRVAARFAWPADALPPDITDVDIMADLLRFKEFVEALPAAS